MDRSRILQPVTNATAMANGAVNSVPLVVSTVVDPQKELITLLVMDVIVSPLGQERIVEPVHTLLLHFVTIEVTLKVIVPLVIVMLAGQDPTALPVTQDIVKMELPKTQPHVPVLVQIVGKVMTVILVISNVMERVNQMVTAMAAIVILHGLELIVILVTSIVIMVLLQTQYNVQVVVASKTGLTMERFLVLNVFLPCVMVEVIQMQTVTDVLALIAL